MKSLEVLVAEFVSNVRAVTLAEARAEVMKSLGGGEAVGHVAKGEKRAPEAINTLTLRLLEFIKKNPGLRIEKIAAGMNVTTKELNLPIKRLLGERRIRTKGQRRATTYTAK
jgi:hypothetical protein